MDLCDICRWVRANGSNLQVELLRGEHQAHGPDVGKDYVELHGERLVRAVVIVSGSFVADGTVQLHSSVQREVERTVEVRRRVEPIRDDEVRRYASGGDILGGYPLPFDEYEFH